MDTIMTQPENYVLGHTDSELQRLITQSRFYGDLSEQALRMAGIKPGMRVLDVGCGSGDVSFLVASIVGPNGSVIGVDRSETTIELAQKRARQAGLQNVTFEVGDVSSYRLSEPVDAIVGRLVIIHLPNPVETLRHLIELVKPGGIVLFEELDISTAYSVPESPLFSNTLKLLIDTFRHAGFEPNTGSQLYSLFRQVGLSEPQLIAGSRVEGGTVSGVYAYFAETVRSMLPLIVRLGLATEKQIEIETFIDRLRSEVTGMGGIIVTPILISAWAQRPA
jgi:ubiquinone/menaquinone biosynthesis C-methylase UbiE